MACFTQFGVFLYNNGRFFTVWLVLFNIGRFSMGLLLKSAGFPHRGSKKIYGDDDIMFIILAMIQKSYIIILLITDLCIYVQLVLT